MGEEKQKEETKGSRSGRGGTKEKMKLTCGVDEGRVELLGEKRVGHVPEELLQQSSHVVNAVLLVQLDVDAAIELLAQLEMEEKEDSETSSHKKKRPFGPQSDLVD